MSSCWRTCQREEVVLITNNRNAAGHRFIREIGLCGKKIHTRFTSDFHAWDPLNRVRTDRDYVERAACFYLTTTLGRLDSVRGSPGRIFIP